ncbi:MAG: transglycosylase domain-containing protein, partial [Gammaproteobacteria bacterium]|nr:transglycosylase domain-containing protein [Gammaproteobacteria bacterium]
PQLLIDSLCFVENRELCEEANPQKNPAVEWGRFSHAAFGQLKEKMGLSNDGSGGSTLATQLEKVRHSRGGVTRSHEDKLQQMVTATAKAYQDGLDTTEQRERIIRDYINEMPLAAFKSYGEVIGFADGITVWFGADFDEVNALLTKPQEGLSDEELRPIARAYRQALTLIMAVKQPSEYLLRNKSAMQDRIEAYLPILAENGVISQKLMRLAQAEKLEFSQTVDQDNLTNDEPKSTDTVRIALMEELGYSNLIQTELWDMSAKSTIDSDVTQGVEDILQQFKDPTSEIAQNIIGFRMANSDTAHQIDYAVTLYEATDDANILRVQADTFKGQFNFNAKSKLELGSTAKLRTLVTYLEVIEELHQRYLNMSDEELAAKTFNEDDHLSIWVNEYMSQPDVDKTKAGILAASMQRNYSGHTNERFFTGGAYHRFHNFQNKDNYRELTVDEAIRRSVNLPLIRMMRDIVNYTLYNQMEIAPDIYINKGAEQRIKYLEQYADKESKIYLWRFWKELRNKTPDEIAETLALKTHKSPVHLTVVYRTVFPEASYEETAEFIKKHCANCNQDGDYADTFENYGPGKFNINDQAYITGLNEIELWLGYHLAKNPDARWADLEKPSAGVRKEGYTWLMKSTNTRAQNKRIRIMIEQEAFDDHIIHRWKKQGFPFDRMVASYASSIGVSGDNPNSLADLAGILMNEGQRKTISTFEEISLAKDTPYETNFKDLYEQSEQVISPEVANIAHHAMQNVVANGTARRAKNSIELSNGRHAIVGGKTGTGYNRKQVTYEDGSKQSIAVNRTATFMFTIDQCMYGTIVAYAPGDMADAQKFTSSLPVQAFKELVPTLMPLFDKACTADYNPTPIPDPTEYTVNVKMDITSPTLPTPPAQLPKKVL